MIKIIRIQDPTDPKEIYCEFAAETNLSEEELQKRIKQLISKHESQYDYDWTYDDLIDDFKSDNFKILDNIDHLIVWG